MTIHTINLTYSLVIVIISYPFILIAILQIHYSANKLCLVKAMVFPVVTYGCENWTVKKAEHRRIDALNYGVGEDS